MTFAFVSIEVKKANSNLINLLVKLQDYMQPYV